MAYGHMRGQREQLFLLPPSMLDWLEEGHLAYFLIDAVELLDTSVFDEVHPTDGAGRPAYDPEMMLTALLYAYATGMRSSRAIEAACRSDLAFRVICANLVPHFTTIASFRAEHEEAIEAFFVEVVKLCHRAGLASLGQIAIDGTKIGSDAALDQNRDENWIRAEIDKILAEASQIEPAWVSRRLFRFDLPTDMVGGEHRSNGVPGRAGWCGSQGRWRWFADRWSFWSSTNVCSSPARRRNFRRMGRRHLAPARRGGAVRQAPRREVPVSAPRASSRSVLV